MTVCFATAVFDWTAAQPLLCNPTNKNTTNTVTTRALTSAHGGTYAWFRFDEEVLSAERIYEGSERALEESRDEGLDFYTVSGRNPT